MGLTAFSARIGLRCGLEREQEHWKGLQMACQPLLIFVRFININTYDLYDRTNILNLWVAVSFDFVLSTLGLFQL